MNRSALRLRLKELEGIIQDAHTALVPNKITNDLMDLYIKLSQQLEIE